ncbi:hypothetical protein [Argonema antarcticum]|uniref:hypothetical protein n=1 Tax=Argonema antarcticum TaxID=2942763 RepID=UPI002010F5A3|nr:hypothetical protein [Argonema antarcticum]MCL1470255.1 hypothetical protein [Argonema antarcticum A004/B2]
MPKKPDLCNIGNDRSIQRQPEEKCHSFQEILRRLHAEGIYIHSEQLAEFLLAHGLPVDLHYVPDRLKEKATYVNKNYQGDMVLVGEEQDEQSWDFRDLW